MFAFLLLWIFLSPVKISDFNSFRPYFVIWNVGQGQWTTFINSENCHHFDLGGEFFPLKKIRGQCYSKDNRLYISHWDSDHMSALRFLKKWPKVCRQEDPIGPSKEKKLNLLNQFNLCDTGQPNTLVVEKIFPLGAEEKFLPDISNAKSKVYLVNNWLLSGDSRIEEEHLWAQRLAKKSVKGFVIGHHGSRTSNSDNLIRQLPSLRWAIASARWRRYKHPHPVVIHNFRLHHKRILRTEDWGNFFFEL